jgi:hypothetical protein
MAKFFRNCFKKACSTIFELFCGLLVAIALKSGALKFLSNYYMKARSIIFEAFCWVLASVIIASIIPVFCFFVAALTLPQLLAELIDMVIEPAPVAAPTCNFICGSFIIKSFFANNAETTSMELIRSSSRPKSLIQVKQRFLRFRIREEDDRHCILCYADYAVEDRIVSLPCKHLYHHDCLRASTRYTRRKICPYCRQRFRWTVMGSPGSRSPSPPTGLNSAPALTQG